MKPILTTLLSWRKDQNILTSLDPLMKQRSIKALTLSELLVASSIMLIIILGITSVDFALRQSSQSTNRNVIVAMRTSATMLHMTRNISQAIGDQANPGVDVATTDICVRQDDPNSPTPSHYTDDFWQCYTVDNTDIYTCRSLKGGAPAVCALIDANHIGTVIAGGLTITLQQDSSQGVLQQYVDIGMTNCYDPTTCDPLNPDPFKNPSYTLSTRVALTAISF